MASPPSPISSLSSFNFSISSTTLEIQKFFGLSSNLTLKEQAEGGEEYRLLFQLFENGFAIIPFCSVQGDNGKVWPELYREGISCRYFYVSSLLDYLRIMGSASFSSPEELETLDYLEFHKNKEKDCFSCLEKVERPFASSSWLRTDSQIIPGPLFRQFSEDENVHPSFSRLSGTLSSLSAPATILSSSVSRATSPVFQKLEEMPWDSEKLD